MYMRDCPKPTRKAQAESPPSSHTPVAQQWAAQARQLAAWTGKWLVNRTDAWGQYLPLGERDKGKAQTRKGQLTEGVLIRELIEDHVYETPDGRQYVAAYLDGKGWGLRPFPTTRAPVGSCADFAGRVRAAAALLADILLVDGGIGQLCRLLVCPPPAGPVQRVIDDCQRAPAQPDVSRHA